VNTKKGHHLNASGPHPNIKAARQVASPCLNPIITGV